MIFHIKISEYSHTKVFTSHYTKIQSPRTWSRAQSIFKYHKIDKNQVETTKLLHKSLPTWEKKFRKYNREKSHYLVKCKKCDFTSSDFLTAVPGFCVKNVARVFSSLKINSKLASVAVGHRARPGSIFLLVFLASEFPIVFRIYRFTGSSATWYKRVLSSRGGKK